MELAFVVAGLAVGILVGMTGVGGGSIMTPLLMSGFGLPANIAVGTDLLYAGSTKLGATATHTRLGHVDWPLVGWLCAGSLPAAGIALYTLHALHTDIAALKTVLTTALGVALIATAASLIFRERLIGWIRRHRAQREPGAAAGVAVGATLGTLVALSSIGAGALAVLAISVLRPYWPATRVVGTDLAHALPLALFAGAGHVMLGNVDWGILALLVAGSIPGAYLGSRLSARLPETLLRRILGVVLLLIGGKFVF